MREGEGERGREYEEAFREELGQMNTFEASLQLIPGTKPKSLTVNHSRHPYLPVFFVVILLYFLLIVKGYVYCCLLYIIILLLASVLNT